MTAHEWFELERKAPEFSQCIFCANDASPFHPEDNFDVCEACREDGDAMLPDADDMPETREPVFLVD